MRYTAENILVKPGVFPDDLDLILSVTPEQAGWQYISFHVRKLAAYQSWSFRTGENELAGSAQTLANQDDPKYAWVKDTYRQKDDRLPLY